MTDFAPLDGPRKRYTVHQFNMAGNFVVKDSQSSWEPILNDKGEIVDHTDPAQMKFFGMTYPEAAALSDKLEATRR